MALLRISILTHILLLIGCSGLQEVDRVEEYHKRGHDWPPSPEEYKPNTPGWRRVMERRFEQIQHVEDTLSKYNGWMSSIYSALLVQNFTENGWAVTRAPQHIVDELRTHLHHGLVNNPPTEGHIGAIGGSENPDGEPLMVVNNELNIRLLEELKPIHEAWAKTELVGNNAYGLRVYRNNSNLNMHVDKSESHVISSILHVDHDPMSEPWPIVIEDFHGNLHEVVLESGDMLLYESSKCYHGRPKRFKGSWYTSLFIHYYPPGWKRSDFMMDTHYRVPPTWHELPENKLDEKEKLIVIDTSVLEPNCENTWCALEDTIKWANIQSVEGGYISNSGVPTKFDYANDEL